MTAASNPFAMLLDSSAAIQAHEQALSTLRKEVHKRADVVPRHLQADVIEFDMAIEMAVAGKAASSKRPAKRASAVVAANEPAANPSAVEAG